MKLYMHPVSTTCRPVMQFIADNNIAVEMQPVDILKGEQYGEGYSKINPNHLVPMLEDGDFRLTESATILRYLADKIGSPAYPKDPKARARVNEVMDWVNTGFYRAFGYGLCYGQLMEPYKLTEPAAQALALGVAKSGAQRYLRVLDQHLLGPNKRYLCGDTITIADYLASGIVSLGEVIGCNFAEYPNVARWYDRMKSLPNWEKANGAVQHWAQMARGPDYVRV